VDSLSIAGSGAHAGSPVLRPAAAAGLPPYGTGRFLADQARLLAASDGLAQEGSRRVDVWMPRVHARECLDLLVTGAAGPRDPGWNDRTGQFERVVRFLAEHRERLLESGLAVSAPAGAALDVTEDLLAGLLRCAAREGAIPAGFLTTFLDEWGHRWM
jgi:hypothetical protein